MAAHLKGVLHVCPGFCKCERCALVLLLSCHLNLSEGFGLRWRAQLSWSICASVTGNEQGFWNKTECKTREKLLHLQISQTSIFRTCFILYFHLFSLYGLASEHNVSHIFPMEYGIFEWFVCPQLCIFKCKTSGWYTICLGMWNLPSN